MNLCILILHRIAQLNAREEVTQEISAQICMSKNQSHAACWGGGGFYPEIDSGGYRGYLTSLHYENVYSILTLVIVNASL